MGFKKAILVLLLLIILTMGAASAADTNTTSDNLAATEETSLKLSENDNFEEKLGIDESTTPLLGPGNSSGKFADLNTLISGATAGDTVTLTVDYCKESDFYDLISIDKELTIDGQGHIIDANNTRDIMRIDNAQNVKLKNIQFINVKGNSSTALYWAYGSDNGLIENCTFTNCLGIDGSAINLIGSNTNIIGSTFINCSGYEGGAIYWGGNDNSIRYSYFENTTANKGGAIYLYGERGRIEGTTFKNCNMPNSTVIYADNIANIIECEFTTTRNETLSSLVYNGNLTNCTLNGISDKYADLNMRIDSNIIGTCKIGDTIELTATVYNNGPDDAKNVSAHFAIPPSLEIIGNTPYAGSFDSMTGIWNIPEIFSTSWATLTITCQAIKAENTTVNAFVSSDAKDLNLTDNNASANLFILRADTTLTLNVSDIFAGETLRIFVDITPIDATGNLTINIGGVEEQSFINGSDVIMKEGLSAGEYNITVTYSGNANYLPAQSNLSFRVNKRNVNLTISLDENTITYGQNATLTAIMPIDGNIAININNETYNITTIAGTGHLLIPTQPAGNHTITATFEGNDQYNPANTTIMLTINKTDPPITINTTDIKYGQNATITVTTLPDATGNLSISIDSKIYGMATIISGTAAFNIPGLTVGNHTVTATYSGDENYNPANKSATQTVNKADVDLGISPYPNATEFKRGDTVEFIINLINNGPSDATNITVNLTLPNSLRYKSSNTSTAYADSQTFIWIIDRLNANNNASITFYCDVMGAGIIALNATASTENEIDTYNTNNAATLLINASESKVVTLDKFDCFFDENGTLLNVSTDELTFEGEFSNITSAITINKAITFIGNNATFKDVSFIVKSDYVGIVNFTIISENATGCAINASSHSNILLSNNTIIYKAMFDSDAYVLYANNISSLVFFKNRVTYTGNTNGVGKNFAIYLTNATTSVIAENIFNLSLVSAEVPWAEVPPGSGNWVSYPISEGIVVENSDNITFDSNTVSVNFTDVVTASGYDTIYSVDFKNSNNAVISNNTIVSEGNSYIYGLSISDCDNFNIEANDIDTTSNYYSNGISIEGHSTGVVKDNEISVKSKNSAYGIYSNRLDGNASATYTDNVIVGNAYNVFGFELDNVESNVTGNLVNLRGNYTTGIAYAGSNLIAENNTIFADASNVGNEYVYDLFGSDTTGIKVIGENSIIKDNTINSTDKSFYITGDYNELFRNNAAGSVNVSGDYNTITENIINTTEIYAVNLGSSKQNTVRDNHLYARELFGNDAVNFTDASNTVISNHPGSTFLTVNATDISYGDSLYIIVSVTENATGKITITNTQANSTEYESDIFDGIAVFNMTGFDVGNYTFNVTYSGDDNYGPCQSNFTVAVNKKLVDMTITAGDITYGEAATITVTTPTDATGTVTICIGDKNYAAEIINGEATFNITGLGAGDYEAIANYTGDANYMACQNTTQFRVSKAPTEISVASDVVNLKVLEEFAPEATLIPDVGYLTFTSYDTSIAIVLNGTIKAIGAGSTIITVNFEGNDNYEASNKTINVTVTLNDASISVNNSTADLKVGESFSIAATTIPDALNVTYIPDDSGVVSVSENGVVTALKEGNGVITVRVGGDGIYAENSTTINVSVGKTDVILTISTEDITYGENATITATMSIDGTVTVNINNENIALEITNGTGQITIPNLNAGEYNIKATFEGNDHYKAANATTTLTVAKSESHLTIQPIPETAYGEDINIIINVQNDATGTITLTVNGENYIKNIENGQATFNITGLNAGNYEAIANYTGDTNYLASQNSTQFTVKSSMKTFEDIANIISNAHAGDEINLEGTYYGTGSTITVNKELSIKGNGETILDAKNLSGILSVSADNVRINNIRFINGKINANGGAINWIGKNGMISNCTFINCSAENGGSVYWNGENGMINTSTFDKSTATQNGGAIYWNANSGEITDSIFTNSHAQNGGAVYVPENRTVEIKSSIFDSNIAEEESGAVYGGTVDDDCIFKNNTYTPLNTTTIISINETAVYTGNDISITTLILSQKGGLVNTGTVEIYINSKLIATIPANTAYIYKTDDLGTYRVLAKFIDDSSYKDSSSTAEFTVIPVDIPEEIETSTAGIFTLEFPDDAEGTLTVFIDGTKYKVYDIIGGILKIDLSDKKGKYNITFEYSGDKNYPAFKKDANITVETNPSITASNAKVLYSAGTTYKITVYKNKGITANNVSVAIKQNNKAFKTIKTNSKGIASFKITQTPGTYKLKITSLGKTVTKTLTVKHIVTLKTATVKKSAKKLILQATLAKVNKKYLKKKTVTFKFNGKKYKAKTNAKGVAKVTIKKSILKKLKVGKKITYQATYAKDTIKKTVKIKK
ncbi:Ig-like domain repeat protein [uncultured Methanobrevibacter sp.]|uniref:Ig-like domain repeat protein n=1 Tax=uncultured Methanobrevibacter sp. TaxID=253161 RepID=UPI0025F6EA30|nr:Ig-like domain repeat protein [uncultured Methanobrevibacter sp.]